MAKTRAHDIKEVHEFVFNGVWIFVLLHIGGLLVAENTDEKWIVLVMIHGAKL